MFLWVRLVLDMLLEQHSVEDLRNTLDELPTELPGVLVAFVISLQPLLILLHRYAAILNRIQKPCNEQKILRLKHIFGWLAFSYRPLKVHELCDLLIFQKKHSVLNDDTKLQKSVLDICKPLLEEHEDHTVALVHFSAREYATL